MSWGEYETCDYCGNRQRITRNSWGEKILDPCDHRGDTSLEAFNLAEEDKNPDWCVMHDRWRTAADKDCP